MLIAAANLTGRSRDLLRVKVTRGLEAGQAAHEGNAKSALNGPATAGIAVGTARDVVDGEQELYKRKRANGREYMGDSPSIATQGQEQRKELESALCVHAKDAGVHQAGHAVEARVCGAGGCKRRHAVRAAVKVGGLEAKVSKGQRADSIPGRGRRLQAEAWRRCWRRRT